MTIEIHLKRTHEANVTTRQRTPAQIQVGNGIVLVVEDDPDVRSATSGMLEDLGYSVVSAESGVVALKLVGTGAKFDLVFSDVVMPDGLSGIELGRRIAAIRPELPVLLTSGYTAQRVIPETSTGEMALLKKPFSQAGFSIAIANILAPPAGYEIEEHVEIDG